MPITLFMTGYAGWGRTPDQFVRAVDAVERSRGFRPPVFVDVRITRSARAVGFKGRSFERQVGAGRYRWIRELGDVDGGAGARPPIRIADPSRAGAVLELAIGLAGERRRAVVLESGRFPKLEGKIVSNRPVIADLLVREARRRRLALEVVEWPGGEPERLDLRASAAALEAIRSGRRFLPLGRRPAPSLLGLPWASIVRLRAPDAALLCLGARAEVQRHEWVLPVLWRGEDTEQGLREAERESRRFRRAHGLEPRWFVPRGGGG